VPWKVQAEIDCDLSSDLVSKAVKGKLLRLTLDQRPLTLDQIVMFKFAENAQVGLQDKRYKFSALEKDGSFELTLDEKP
jgi:hypothetical protein